MNGLAELTTEDKLKEFEQELNMFSTSLGLGNLRYTAEVDEAMSLSAQQLDALQPEYCDILVYKLHQYSLFLQQVYNRMKNICDWAQHNIQITTAMTKGEYDKWTKYEERISLTVINNSYAKKLNQIWLDAKSKQTELEFTATRIKNIADALERIANYKRQKK